MQVNSTLNVTSQYVPHIDKIGYMAALYQAQGVSYNFVVVQKSGKKTGEVIFDDNKDFIRYYHYKT